MTEDYIVFSLVAVWFIVVLWSVVNDILAWRRDRTERQ